VAQSWAILLAARRRDTADMPRPVLKSVPTVSKQLEKLLGYPWPFPGRPPKRDLSTWTVTDDRPERVPVIEAEMEVFERWFAGLFDELFGSVL
jgi:hypothetical protein